MYRIVMVDDDPFSLHMLSKILENEYELKNFTSGNQLLSYLQKDTADMILLDYLMPEKDGIEVLAEMRKNPKTASIPVVILTADQNVSLEITCFKNGAEDFITKPFSPEVVRSRIKRILDLKKLRENLQFRLDEKTRQMENVMLQAFTTVANIVDAKDDFTEEHSVHVAEYAARIAKELGWSDKEVYNIYYTGLLHDIGKISVPDKIIRKSSSLSDKEWRVMHGHTSIGSEILKDVHIVKMASAVALYHHERYDGTGYPMGIKGEEIPLEARIVSLANAYESMTSNRIYRNRLTREQLFAELLKGKGTQFDPVLVDVLLKMIKENRFDADVLPADLKNIQPGTAEESSQLLFKVLEANNKTVKREATKDSLTGLYNRNYTEKYISMYLRQNKCGAYFMIDLDNFKQVNDRYGHIAGDYALKNIANMLSEVADNVGIACRMGGDEFCLFFQQEMEEKELHGLAASMLEEYEKIKHGNECIEGTSLSIGIALAPEDGTSYQELYNAADKALYLSKHGGKNRYCFYNDGVVSEPKEVSNVIDIRQLKELMQIGRERKGSYQVQYNEFQRIYEFILRCIERNHQHAQLLLFSLKPQGNGWDSPEALEDELQNLELAIVNSLRRNDVSTRYSSSQVLAVLIDSKEEYVDVIIQRILDNYDSLQRHPEYEVRTERMAIDESMAIN